MSPSSVPAGSTPQAAPTPLQQGTGGWDSARGCGAGGCPNASGTLPGRGSKDLTPDLELCISTGRSGWPGGTGGGGRSRDKAALPPVLGAQLGTARRPRCAPSLGGATASWDLGQGVRGGHPMGSSRSTPNSQDGVCGASRVGFCWPCPAPARGAGGGPCQGERCLPHERR